MLIIITIAPLAPSIAPGTLWVCSKCEMSISAKQNLQAAWIQFSAWGLQMEMKKKEKAHRLKHTFINHHSVPSALKEEKQRGNFRHTYMLVKISQYTGCGEGWKKPWSAGSSMFYSINTSIMDVFKLPMWCHQTGSWEKVLTMCSLMWAISSQFQHPLYLSWAFPLSSCQRCTTFTLWLTSSLRMPSPHPWVLCKSDINATKIIMPDPQVSCGHKNSMMFFYLS